MFDRKQFENYTLEELVDAQNTIEKLVHEKKSERYDFLVQQVLNAMSALEKEFPFSEMIFEYDDCEINLLNHTWDKTNFSM